MMITHSLSSALQLGNRTLMMDRGNIVFDVKGTERDSMQANDLLAAFKQKAGKALEEDRVLLQN